MANTSNVQYNDYLQIPAQLHSFPVVKISWYQDGIRTATYSACYGYNEHSDRRDREVLVFIATEMIADSYSFASGHLSRNKYFNVERPPSDKAAGNDAPYRNVRMDEKWQYGSLGASDRFVVYHPQSRRPFSKRFTESASQTPGALNSILADAKVGLSAVGSDYSSLFILGSMMSLGIAQSVIGKVLETANAGLGESLTTFKAE